MNTPPLPTRCNLHALIAEPPGEPLNAHLTQLHECVSLLEATRARLTSYLEEIEFLEILDQYEWMSRTAQRLGAYTTLWFSEGTQNQPALSLQSRIDELLAGANNRTLFFTLWFKDLPDDAARRLIEASGDRHYFLESLRNGGARCASCAQRRRHQAWGLAGQRRWPISIHSSACCHRCLL